MFLPAPDRQRDDDLAFIRAITVPRRGIGAATIESLGHYAAHRHISLFHRHLRGGVAEHVGARQLESLREFCHFMNRIAHRAPGSPPARSSTTCSRRSTTRPGWLYESCEPARPRPKWANVGDFTGWLGRKGEEDGKTLSDMIQTISLITMLDKDDAELDQVQLATCTPPRAWSSSMCFWWGVEGLLPTRVPSTRTRSRRSAA